MSQRTGRQASPEESLGLQSIGFRACVKQRRNREVDETLTTDSRGSCRGWTRYRVTWVVPWCSALASSSCLSRCLALASLALGFYCLRSGNYFNISLLVPCSCLPADTSRFILSLMLWNCFCLFIINILIQKCVVLIQLTYIEMAETLPSERIPTNHSENWTGASPTLTEGHESNDSSYYLN